MHGRVEPHLLPHPRVPGANADADAAFTAAGVRVGSQCAAGARAAGGVRGGSHCAGDACVAASTGLRGL